MEAVQESTRQTRNFAAEFGQVGGGLFNFTAKSGGNGYHGSAYEYFSNEAADSVSTIRPLPANVQTGGIIPTSRNGQLVARFE